jgi:transcriptional regulator with XRE-family HTH domain
MPTLRELRKERVMTQTDLAEKAGLSWRTVYRIEKGEVTPVFKTINKLAHGLGVEPGIIQFKPANTDVSVNNTELVSYVTREENEYYRQKLEQDMFKMLDAKINAIANVLREEMNKIRFWTGRAQLDTCWLSFIVNRLVDEGDEFVPGYRDKLMEEANKIQREFRDQYWPLIAIDENEPGKMGNPVDLSGIIDSEEEDEDDQ